MYTVTLKGFAEAQKVLDEARRRGLNLAPALMDMGEHMVNSSQDNFTNSQDNFTNSQAPDGTPWAANSPVTFAKLLGAKNVNKRGKINKRGAGKVMSKRPLIGISGFRGGLAGSIRYQLSGSMSMVFGSNKAQAAMMHFGGTKAEFPHLWGDIPARPFVGISETDKGVLLEIAVGHLVGT